MLLTANLSKQELDPKNHGALMEKPALLP